MQSGARRNPWWLATQAFSILASILLAFAIQAWWEDRQDQQMANALLEALNQDVARLQRQLEIDKEFNRGIFSAVVELLKASTAENDLSDRDIDVLISKIIWFNGGSMWLSGALDALVSDGQIELIEDGELRLRLSNLHVQLADLRAFYANDESFHHETLMPFLIENGYMLEVIDVAQHPVDDDFDYGYPKLELQERRSNKLLLEDYRFQNLLMGKLDRYLDLKNFVFPLIEAELKDTEKLLDVVVAH